MALGSPALVSVVLVALALGAAGPAGLRGTPAPGFAVAVSATPSFGSAPLTVLLEASVSAGSPTFYQWSFGDGTYLNGSNRTYADPEHLYVAPGTYAAQVNVSEGSAVEVGTIPVHVLATGLAVRITATPATGVVPLTVTFRANASGGSDTYVWVNWSFGDGSTGSGFEVQYTYERAGDFYVTVAVEDSDRTTSTAAVWVNLSAPAVDGPTPLGTVELWAVIGFVLGAVAVVAAVTVRDRWTGSDLGPEPEPPIGIGTMSLAPPPPRAPPPGPTEVPTGPSGEAPSPPVLRLSQRIVVHLAGQGTLGPYDVAPATVTQAGMAAALGVRQNGLTNVLRRLVAAGVLTEEVRHVAGAPRRLKVYRLTPRGELLARELRHRPPPPPA